MKKLFFVVVLVVLATSFALAQPGTVIGNTSYVPTVDNMGAHENGGRGCAGCHAPHSGGRGSGGNIISGTGASYTAAGTAEGDTGLWGTDTNPIETGNGGNITFTGSYPVALAGLTWSSGALYTGVVTCLSCHDGNVSTGAMMSGTSYEQNFGLLNFSSVSNLTSTYNATTGNWTRVGGLTGPQLYGNQPIPTLLGNDGGTLGDYANDHPVGPKANLLAVLEGGSWSTYGVTTTVSASNRVSIKVTAGSMYANMVGSYGYPALASLAGNGASSDGSTAFIVCTTCHNQHVMNVYQSAPTSWSSALPIGGTTCATAGNCETFQTIFFVNGPYNPGAPYDPKHLPSTMRFCQQCHFNMSPESYGATGIGTAF
jgi:hypothetical protein